MVPRDRGKIIQVGSAFARRGIPLGAQLGWVRARTRNEPMPVPPVYQPEVAARAIVWAADHDRRALWVGASTAMTIIGSRLAPWVAEWYLARTGCDGQQTDTPLDPHRPDYLFDVLDDDRDRGSHGSFDDQAHRRSPQLVLAAHRRAVVAVVAAVAAVAAGLGAAAAAVTALLRG